MNDVVNNYKKNFNNLLNLVFGKESIEKFIIILQKILEIKIKKFYSNINSLNDRFYIQFYQKNFKDSFFLSSKTREILYKFEEIEKKIKNIENDFELNIVNTLKTQLNIEFQFLYNKFSDLTNENLNKLFLPLRIIYILINCILYLLFFEFFSKKSIMSKLLIIKLIFYKTLKIIF